MQASLRQLPAVDSLAQGLPPHLPLALRNHCAREALAQCRASILGGQGMSDAAAQAQALAQHLAAQLSVEPLPTVINATGTVLHTGLGRAPLSQRARQAAQRVLTGYCQLEFDLAQGQRGNRQDHVAPLLCALTGAEAALVVNNCAGATVLILQALASGKVVPVSRGELVEIGGSFRVPEIMACAGCHLREVGSTNRTRIADYAAAIDDDTAALMRVSQSNFRQVGFVEQVDTPALARLAREHHLPLIIDQGSGCLQDLSRLGNGLQELRSLGDELAAGADIVCGSGDKILGGPQAGIIVGSAALVHRCARHPMARALRCDKVTLAALAGTLHDYCFDDPFTSIPSLAMLGQDANQLQVRAQALIDAIGTGQLWSGRGAVGSGAMPDQGPTSWGVALAGAAGRLQQSLRQGRPPVIGRIHKDTLILDCLTIGDDQIETVATAVKTALKATDTLDA